MHSFLYKNKFMELYITASDTGITKIDFKKPEDLKPLKKTEIIQKACSQLDEYFLGRRKVFELPLEPEGTDFQKKVWEELSEIPYGRTRSYKQIAEKVGNGKACRAVGMANNRNPVPIIIPCHRVIGSNGSLVGYANGLDTKMKLLELEKSNSHYFEYGNAELLYLRKKDKRLAEAINKYGSIEREVIPDLFIALIYHIIGQQIATKALETIWQRFVDKFGEITPANIAKQSIQDIQSVGISMRKASYIQENAKLIERGGFELEALKEMSDEAVAESLSHLPGVGVWTAEMLMIFSMERKDILSWDDLIIRRGMCKTYHMNDLNKEQFIEYKKQYSPYGTIAAFYLWAIGNDKE